MWKASTGNRDARSYSPFDCSCRKEAQRFVAPLLCVSSCGVCNLGLMSVMLGVHLNGRSYLNKPACIIGNNFGHGDMAFFFGGGYYKNEFGDLLNT